MDSPPEPVAELGLFPLDTVLLPGEFLPLHIFEPRYRELIGECLDTAGEFGLIYHRVYQDGSQAGPVGTRAAVAETLQRYDDGRLDVVVSGGDRFRLLELTTGRSFITATVAPFADAGSEPDPGDELATCRAAFSRILAVVGDPEGLGDDENPDSFTMAARLGLPSQLKQELLDMTSERARLVRLTEELTGPLATQLQAREIGRRASTNGKVDNH
jgi:ATP-dependent Lon protease